MDNRKVKIKQLTKGDVFIPCQFTDRQTNKVISLIEGGKYGRVIDRPLVKETEKLKEVKFSAGRITDANVSNVFYEIEYDRDARNSQETEVVIRFWSKHPKVQNVNEVNPNLDGEPILQMEDLTLTKNNDAGFVAKKFEGYKKFSMLNDRGKRNVAYRFGVMGADNLDEQDLILTLIDPVKGILMRTDDATHTLTGDPIPCSLDRFLNYDSDDFGTQLAINVRRAIEKKVGDSFIIERKSDVDGTTYYINNHPIGKNENDVIRYLDANKDFYYKYVVERLGDEAEKQKKEAKKVQDEGIQTIDKEGQKREMRELHDRLKAIGVKGAAVGKWNTMENPDKIAEAIIEAKAILKEKEKTVEV